MKNKLYFSYGGFRGPNYEIKYKDKRFHISLGEMSSQSIFDVSYPDEQKWDKFWFSYPTPLITFIEPSFQIGFKFSMY